MESQDFTTQMPPSSYPQTTATPVPQRLLSTRRSKSLPLVKRFLLNGSSGPSVSWLGSGAGKTLIVYDDDGEPAYSVKGGNESSNPAPSSNPVSAASTRSSLPISTLATSRAASSLAPAEAPLDTDDDLTDLEDLDEYLADDDEPDDSTARFAVAKQAVLDAHALHFVPATSGKNDASIRAELSEIEALMVTAVAPWIRAAGQPGLNATQGVSWAQMKKDAGSYMVDTCKRVRGVYDKYYAPYIGTFNDLVLKQEPTIAAPNYTVSAGRPLLDRNAAYYYADGHWAKSSLDAAIDELYQQAGLYQSLTGLEPNWPKFRLSDLAIDHLYSLFVKHKEFDGNRKSFLTLYVDQRAEQVGGKRWANIRPFLINKVKERLAEDVSEGKLRLAVAPNIDSYRTTVQRNERPSQDIIDFSRLYLLNKRVARVTDGGSYALKKIPAGMHAPGLVDNFRQLAMDASMSDFTGFMAAYDQQIVETLQPEIAKLLKSMQIKTRLQEAETSSSKAPVQKSYASRAARARRGSESDQAFDYWLRVGAENTGIEEQAKITAPVYENLVEAAALPIGDSQDLAETLTTKRDAQKFDLTALRKVACGAMTAELVAFQAEPGKGQTTQLVNTIVHHLQADVLGSIGDNYGHNTSSLETCLINCSRVQALCRASPELAWTADVIVENMLLFLVWTMRSKQPVLPIIAFMAWLDSLWLQYSQSSDYTPHAVRIFDQVEADIVFALTAAAFKTTAGWICYRNGRTATGHYTNMKSPNPAFIEQIRDLQFGQSGSLDSLDAILWHPDQRMTDREPRYVAVGSWRARTPDRFLKRYSGIPVCVCGPCPWWYICGTWIPCLGLVWLTVGYAFRYTDKNKRGKPNIAALHQATSRAQALARSEQLLEADESFRIGAIEPPTEDLLESTEHSGDDTAPSETAGKKGKEKAKEVSKAAAPEASTSAASAGNDNAASTSSSKPNKQPAKRSAPASSSKRPAQKQRTIPQDD